MDSSCCAFKLSIPVSCRCHLRLQEFGLLSSAINDAVAVERLLRTEQGFTTVALLLNERATKLNIERALDTAHTALRRDAETGRLRCRIMGDSSTSSSSTSGSAETDVGKECAPGPIGSTTDGSRQSRHAAQSSLAPGNYEHSFGLGEAQDQFLHRMSEAGRFVLFFAGHGIKVT